MTARKRADARLRDRRQSPKRPRARMQRRARTTAQETKHLLADAQQQPSDEEGNRGEGELQREPEQEAGLKDGVEREALGVKQPLADLLKRECEQRQREAVTSAD